jgi:hypothetical protein
MAKSSLPILAAMRTSPRPVEVEPDPSESTLKRWKGTWDQISTPSTSPMAPERKRELVRNSESPMKGWRSPSAPKYSVDLDPKTEAWTHPARGGRVLRDPDWARVGEE